MVKREERNSRTPTRFRKKLGVFDEDEHVAANSVKLDSRRRSVVFASKSDPCVCGHADFLFEDRVRGGVGTAVSQPVRLLLIDRDWLLRE